MQPSFLQTFEGDDVMFSVLNSLRSATRDWAYSSLSNEAVLLNNVADALLSIGSDSCKSPIYPDIEVSSSRTILDRQGPGNTDKFGADLGVTLTMEEDGVVIKQRTALFQLKVGSLKSGEVTFKLDLRQVYLSGHNKHSFGRWFMAVCERTRGSWKFASERQVASTFTEEHTSAVAHEKAPDRTYDLLVTDEWANISEWAYDWLSGHVGIDSDLTDPNRIEIILDKMRAAYEKKKTAGQDLSEEFDEQFFQNEHFLPRVHINYVVKTKSKKN